MLVTVKGGKSGAQVAKINQIRFNKVQHWLQ